MDLEAKLADVQKEVVEGGATRKTRSAADWIPRPPEKLVNSFYLFFKLFLTIKRPSVHCFICRYVFLL